ncbi:MAG: class I SAM-dependent methyltransferase [Gammaproteobacteria bacterium]
MAEMFASAKAYESMMGRWSTRLAPLFVDFARVRSGARILDLGCGTGSLVQTLADRATGSEIVGIDPAQPFIDYCRGRFTNRRISFDCGNGMDLPYANNSFDHSLSLLVFHLIPQPEKAASEMRRVTRPGGTVAACTWDSDRDMSAIFWGEAVRLDPAADARAERPRHCNRQGQLAALWHATGLKDIEETGLEIRTDFSSLDDYWLPFTKGVGPQGVYVADLSPERRGTLRGALRKRLLADRPDGPISLSAHAWAVRGTVPS